MGNWYRKNNNEKKYIVFEENDIKREFNSVAIGMLMNNAVSCLIPCTVSQTDNKRIVSFNVSSYQEMGKFLEKETTFDFVSDLFMDMCDNFIKLRKYMIDPGDLIFDMDKMYVDAAEHRIKFLIDPLLNDNRSVDCKALFRNIIVNLKLDDRSSRRVGFIISMINKDSFSVEGFLSDLKSGGRENPPVRSTPPVQMVSPSFGIGQETHNYAVQESEPKRYEPDVPPVAPKSESLPPVSDTTGKKQDKWWGKLFKKGSETKPSDSKRDKGSALSGLAIPGVEDAAPPRVSSRSHTPAPAVHYPENDTDTTVIEGDSDLTDVLEETEFPKLISKTAHASVSLNKDIFKIGRDPKLDLDLVLNTKLVSHHHATIKHMGGSYFIVDENSTNHVYVNGRRIPVNSEFPLNSGDTVKLGSEEFIFEI